MINRKLTLLGAGLLLTAATASAQSRVTGRVTDSHGEPVMGASVRVAGTKIVTTTDAQGQFTLTGVPASAKHLNISYIGMQAQRVSIAGNVKVVLKDNELSEAVVVGYGTAQKVGTVVGSIKKVGGEVVADKPSTNIADAFAGKVAGMSVSNMSGDAGVLGSVSIQIRGAGSLNASNEPLIVIDGSPADPAMFNMLNDMDIESITTLKDASATSIYGSRAANGVIYITTKRGRSGEQAQVSIGQRVGWSQLANGLGNPMNANELLQFQLENNIITADQYALYKNHGANTNWQKYYFDNAAPTYNTDFSIRGGSDKTTYYVSGSYMKQKSLTRVSHFDRYTLRTNLETKAKDWLTFGLKQNATYTDRKADEYTNGTYAQYVFNNNVSGAMKAQPYYDPYDPDAQMGHYVWPDPTLPDMQWIQTQRPRQTNDIVYNGVAYAQLTPVKGLTLKSQLGLNAFDSRSSAKVMMTIPGATSGSASESHSRTSIWTITNTAEYKFNIGEDHAFTLLAGQEGMKESYRGFGASGTGIGDDRLNTLGNVTKANLPTSGYYKYETLSFFGRVDYALKDKYFLNFTIRNDKNSRFGKKNNAANFYSGGAMWRISAEDFMAETRSWINDLQLKVSVGSTGNSELGQSTNLANYYASLGITGATQYNGETGWIISQPANEELGWEKQIQTNVGVSARMFDRLDVSVNFYHRKTKDMLMSVPLPYTTGFSSQMLNIGEMSNRGVEFEASADVIRSRDYFFTIYANYAYNVNKIDKLFYGYQTWPLPTYNLNYVVGETLQYYLPIFAGVDKEDGAPMWYKQGHKGGVEHVYNPETMTKTMSEDIYQLSGKPMDAPHNGGFGLSGGWKGLSITADFAYSLNKWMLDGDYLGSTNGTTAQAGFNLDKDMLHMWRKPGDITDIAYLGYKTYPDTRVLKNSSYLRMKNLTVAYKLPERWMKASRFFESVQLSFTARNLFTITKWKGADPEPATNAAMGRYPATRNYTLGVDVTF